MSRTRHRTKHPGDDFWSRRCFGSGCLGTGPVPKWKTKMKERTRDRKIIQQAYYDPENVEGRFPGE